MNLQHHNAVLECRVDIRWAAGVNSEPKHQVVPGNTDTVIQFWISRYADNCIYEGVYFPSAPSLSSTPPPRVSNTPAIESLGGAPTNAITFITSFQTGIKDWLRFTNQVSSLMSGQGQRPIQRVAAAASQCSAEVCFGRGRFPPTHLLTSC